MGEAQPRCRDVLVLRVEALEAVRDAIRRPAARNPIAREAGRGEMQRSDITFGALCCCAQLLGEPTEHTLGKPLGLGYVNLNLSV